MKNCKFINAKNYFNKESFNEICNELEKGEAVHVYIDCAGLTRAETEGLKYHYELKNKYGYKLECDNDGISWNYKLIS